MQAHGEVPDDDAMLPPSASWPRAHAARQNGRMVAIPRLRSIFLPLLAAAVLAACNDEGAQRDAPTARFESPDAELSWQGVLACADCDGIDTRLRLQRGNGVVAQYELVEAYLDGEGAEYFHEAGRWRRDGRILRLQATSGGERLYAIDGTGNLVVVDRRGNAAGPGRVLSPAGPPGL
jgi:hypothetical protein